MAAYPPSNKKCFETLCWFFCIAQTAAASLATAAKLQLDELAKAAGVVIPLERVEGNKESEIKKSNKREAGKERLVKKSSQTSTHLSKKETVINIVLPLSVNEVRRTQNTDLNHRYTDLNLFDLYLFRSSKFEHCQKLPRVDWIPKPAFPPRTRPKMCHKKR